MDTNTIPDAALARLTPFLKAYARRAPDHVRDAIDDGHITCTLRTDGTVHHLEVRLLHDEGSTVFMRLDPTQVGLHVNGGQPAYVPSDDG